MALILADRVRDTTTTTGTGTVTLSGTAPTGYQTFGAAIGDGNTTYYTINGGSEWEVGIGTYTAAGTTLSRDTVLASSAGGTTKVAFSAGTKDVFVTYPAEKSVNYDASNNVGIGTTSPAAKLDVQGSGSVYVRARSTDITGSTIGYVGAEFASGSQLQMRAGNGYTYLISAKATDALLIGTAGTERMRIDSGGRFGFGTSAPASFTTFAAPSTSAAAWTTSGINMVQSAATFTDTTSTGTVADIRINNFAPQTLAASNAITATVLYGAFFSLPVAGTNVTATATAALGCDNLRVVGGTTLGNGMSVFGAINLAANQTTSAITVGGPSGTATITLGQSTASQTTNIQAGATASGSTKTINLGTGGLSGSTTAITIGSAVSGATQTTTVNGRVTLAPIGASAAAWTTSGVGLIQSAATFTDTSSTGTVADIRMNNFAAQTLAASNTITATNLYGTYFTSPVAGTNVTGTNIHALGADTLRVNGTLSGTGAVSFSTTTGTISLGTSQTTGTLTVGATGQTGTITLGRSTDTQTTNIQAGATASGSTKTINLGTGGLSGSTTAIAIGSTAGTSTTTMNGNTATPAGSTGMTSGFFYIPAAAGAPSGTPTAITGTVPMYYDTTNNKFYVYNGAWKSVTLA